MAQSLETLRSNMQTSIFGRRLGLDDADFMVGPKDIKGTIEDLTTATTGTDVTAYGTAQFSTAAGTGPVQHRLAAPVPGVMKKLINGSSSTASLQFLSTPNGASIVSASDGTTKAVVNLLGPGASVTLIGLTTAKWGVVAMYDQSSTLGVRSVSFTTST